MKIADINKQPNKALVYDFEGVVRKSWPRKSGVYGDDNKPWSIQTIVVADDAGDEIKVMLKDRHDVTIVEAQHIRLATKESPKGHSGVYADDDTYQGNTTRQIRVTPSGQLFISGKLDVPGGVQQDAPMPERKAAAVAAIASASDEDDIPFEAHEVHPDDRPKPEDVPRDAKLKMLQIANLYAEAARASEYVAKVHEATTGHLMPEAWKQACASSIFIKADRMGLADQMPARSLL